MNWREWIYGILNTEPTLIAVIPGYAVSAGGAITNRPDDPMFVIYRLQNETSRINANGKPVVSSRIAEIWVYDTPGSYDRIDNYLAVLRGLLCGPVVETNAIACRWLGDSSELFDDELKSGVRYGTYELIGRF